MTIGILLPLSNAHPGIFKDFLDGLNSLLSLQDFAGQVTIKKESIGFGGTEKEVYAKAEKLLVNEDVDILMAYIDEKVTGMLYSIVQSTGKLLIIINPGANHPLNWVPQPTVIHLTLQHSFLCSLTGALASAQNHKQAAYASSFYDCGYLHSLAMVKSFSDTGGKIVFNYINNQIYDKSFEISQLTNFLNVTPDCASILCLYDELPSSLFYDRLKAYNGSLNLFVSPMMMNSKALSSLETDHKLNIQGYLSWLPGLTNDINIHFARNCKRTVTGFSLLGWEAGLVVAELLRSGNHDFEKGESLVSDLTNSVLKSPRGEMTLDKETLYYTSQIGRFSLEQGTVEPIIDWNCDYSDAWKAFTLFNIEGAVAGWTNTYLCY